MFRRRPASRCRRPPADRPSSATTHTPGSHRGSRPSRIQPNISATVAAASGNPSSTGANARRRRAEHPKRHRQQKPRSAAAEDVQPGVGRGIRDWGLGIVDWSIGDEGWAVHRPLDLPPVLPDPCPLTPDPY